MEEGHFLTISKICSLTLIATLAGVQTLALKNKSLRASHIAHHTHLGIINQAIHPTLLQFDVGTLSSQLENNSGTVLPEGTESVASGEPVAKRVE